jgi:hypothetical protein
MIIDGMRKRVFRYAPPKILPKFFTIILIAGNELLVV